MDHVAERRAVGGTGTWDRDPSTFVDLLLQRSIEKYDAARQIDGPVVFDRGIPDCVAFARLFDVDPAPSLRASDAYRYHDEVFVLAP